MTDVEMLRDMSRIVEHRDEELTLIQVEIVKQCERLADRIEALRLTEEDVDLLLNNTTPFSLELADLGNRLKEFLP
ncbi:hypothetical protein LCGC14_1192210 [marine sediment metagenome]|uniref:Uncharacterized protein n=1 Tax=marine sediment metagenome TaxID=412755 RepID=A0A0F9PPC8_9ZZZZ